MAIGISAKLPLHFDGHSGKYKLNKTYREVVKQNFKNMLLTSPGERIMNPRFGAGLRALLFEMDHETLRSEVTLRIQEQINMYMPFITITEMSFSSPLDTLETDPQTLSIKLRYTVPSLNISDFLDVDL